MVELPVLILLVSTVFGILIVIAGVSQAFITVEVPSLLLPYIETATTLLTRLSVVFYGSGFDVYWEICT